MTDETQTQMQSPPPAPACVPAFDLRGHTAAVLCLHAGPAAHPHLLLSGSEDATCRVWDVRCGQAVRCLKASSASASASAPPASVSAVLFHPRCPYTVFLGVEGGRLQRFDLRASAQIVLRDSAAQWEHHSEEINQMHANAAGTHLAACDDAGDVCVMDLQRGAGQLCKTLSGKHTNLCTCVQFRPKCSSEVWSGGMDSQVVVWDHARGRPLHSFSTLPVAGAASSSQTLNPPFVHSLSFTAQGDTALVGSGNAEILCLDAKRKAERRRLVGHTHSVMHVSMLALPPSFAALPSFRAPHACMLSAGNDQHLLLWDLTAALAEAARAPAPAAAAASSSSSFSASSSASSSAAAKNRRKKERARARKAAAVGADGREEAEAAEEEEEAVDESTLALEQMSVGSAAAAASSSSSSSAAILPAFSSPHLPPSLPYSAPERQSLDTSFVRFRWRHPHKINAVATSLGMRDEAARGASLEPPEVLCTSGVCVYVADTTSVITAYQLK